MEETEEMEMPTPCQKCNDWFDLTDGCGSVKWFPDTVICEKCKALEDEEVEMDEEIERLKTTIDEAVDTIKESRDRLGELGQEVPFVLFTPFY